MRTRSFRAVPCAVAQASTASMPGAIRAPGLIAALSMLAMAGLPAVAQAQWMNVIDLAAPDADGGTAVRTFVRPASAPELVLGYGAGAPVFDGRLTPAFVATGGAPEGDGPSDVQYTPDGATIVVAHRESKNIVLFNAATRAFIRAIDVGGAAQAVAIAPDGVTAVVAVLDTREAVFVNLSTGAEIARVPVGAAPGVVKINAAGTRAVVGNAFDSSVTVIDMATQTEIHTIGGVGFTQTISATPESGQTGLAYSEFEFVNNSTIVNANRFNDRLDFVNIETGDVTQVPTVDAPAGVAVSASGAILAVSHAGSLARVSVVDVPSRTVTTVITMPSTPDGPICINGAGTKAVVSVPNAAHVVDLVAGTVSPSINTASNSGWLTTADGNYAVGVGFRGSLISFATSSLVKDLNNYVSTSIGAVSPVDSRAALVAPNFGEDLVTVTTNGAAGAFEGVVFTGPDPEFDRTRMGAITPSGSRAAAVGMVSDSLAVFDTASGSIISRARTGQRPGGVGLTSDGSKAVVANLDDFFATIHNVTTNTTTTVPMGRRAGLALISPDGQYAYLPVIADGDGVHRINLNTLAQDGPKLLTGDMGSVAYAFSPVSGATLSPDGSVLVTCNSFSNTISIIDTAAWTVVRNLPVGTFPTYAAFSPDGGTLYVSNSNGSTSVDTVSVVSMAGASSSVVATISVGNAPWIIEVGATHAYVLNTQSFNEVLVIDRASNAVTGTIDLPELGIGMELDDAAGRLYVTSGEWLTTLGGSIGYSTSNAGRVRVYDTATNSEVEVIDTGKAPSSFKLSENGAAGIIPSPGGDGAVLLTTGSNCPADFSGDGFVDDTDFVTFAAAYQDFSVPPADARADFSGDGFVDDTDFVTFAAAYEAFNCQ